MNIMKHKLVQRGLEEYKAVLLSLLGIIMGRGEVYDEEKDVENDVDENKDLMKNNSV